MNPARMNSAPVANPWLTMYRVAPVTPCEVITKMPSTMKPKCEIDVYAISRFISCWPIATIAPYKMPITASVMTSGVKYLAPSGNRSKQYRSMPNVPTLSSTPTSSTAPPGWAEAAASGSQVWNGHSGALIANAMKKPRNSHFCTVGDSDTWVSSLNRNEPWSPVTGDFVLYTYSAMIATSMSSPPSRLYSRNFTAAYCRLPTP